MNVLNSNNLSAYAWQTNTPSALNTALVEAAKSILQGIYTYTQDAPDYLPTSYEANAHTFQNTSYTVHATHQSYVVWANVEKPLRWVSEPVKNNEALIQKLAQEYPKQEFSGWSGYVSEIKQQPETTTQCFTDCSGYITSLFAYAQLYSKPQFNSWEINQIIPEAGCFNPEEGNNRPNEINYYNFITHGKYFQEVALADLAAGDIIAYANSVNRNDSGHIMLVIAVANEPTDNHTRYVVVSDETGTAHTDKDTRFAEKGKGAGMGIIKLVQNGAEVQFYWSANENIAPEGGKIKLGRAL